MYYLLGLSIFAASLNSIMLNKSHVNTKNEIFRFNFLCSVVWCVILLAVCRGEIKCSVQVLLWGILYGVTQALFILFKTAAMSSGSVSVTTLVGNSSLLISIIVSMVVWGEKITVVDIIGLAVMAAAIFLCTYEKTDEVFNPKWKYYAIFFLIFAAGVGISFKAFGKSGNLEYCSDMMFVSSVVMLVFYFTACLLSGGFKNENISCGSKSVFVKYALISGVLSCLYNRLNIFLSGSMAAVIFFPSFNGGVVFLSALLSACLCGEKMVKKRKIGLGLGIIGIIIIGIL